MAEADGVAVDFLVWLELQAFAQLQAGAWIGAVAFTRQRELGALGIDELAVGCAVVMFFVVAGREQAAEAQLFAHGGP